MQFQREARACDLQRTIASLLSAHHLGAQRFRTNGKSFPATPPNDAQLFFKKKTDGRTARAGPLLFIGHDMVLVMLVLSALSVSVSVSVAFESRRGGCEAQRETLLKNLKESHAACP